MATISLSEGLGELGKLTDFVDGNHLVVNPFLANAAQLLLQGDANSAHPDAGVLLEANPLSNPFTYGGGSVSHGHVTGAIFEDSSVNPLIQVEGLDIDVDVLKQAVAAHQVLSILNAVNGGNDHVIGSSIGDDLTIVPGAGDDSVEGKGGNDQIDGGAGNDTLIGGEGADTISGGDGTDTADYQVSTVGVNVELSGVAGHGGDAEGDLLTNIEYLMGSSHDDTLKGDTQDNYLWGLVGNDLLISSVGADTFDGGIGNDMVSYLNSATRVEVALSGGPGVLGNAAGDILINIENLTGSFFADKLTGDTADNLIDGNIGKDTIFGGGGNDTLVGGAGNDSLDGGADNDFLLGGTGNDTTLGGGGDDNLAGGAGNDSLDGGADNDFLLGGTGNDTLVGGAGNDILSGGAGDDLIDGGDGRDGVSYLTSTHGVVITLSGGPGAGGDADGDVLIRVENLVGSTHDDSVTGDSAINILAGGAGNDTLLGMAGKDTLNGGSGNDLLSGGVGADRLNGNAGSDTLSGDAGSDALVGGTGDDLLSGGLNTDFFIFRAGDGHDTITDFVADGFQDFIVATQDMVNRFVPHLVLDALTSAVIGVEVDFFNAEHVSQGSILLQHVLSTDLITAADFHVG